MRQFDQQVTRRFAKPVEWPFIQMNLPNFYPMNLITLTKLSAALVGSLLCLSASAQTTAAGSQPSELAPLNLDADAVAKAMSKEAQPSDIKPDVLSSTHGIFEQSLLDAENRKKVHGMVEAGVETGKLPAYRGLPAENVTCENTAVAVSDAIDRNTQVGVYAEANRCRVH